jgi:hypothetical protein
MALLVAVDYLRTRGVEISRASLYRWSAARVAAGESPLIHQPTGPRGRTFVVPAEVMEHIRSRCSESQPASPRRAS